MRSRSRWSPWLVALLSVSCAGPAQLAKISDRQLQAGQVREAYETARRGVEKEPLGGPAHRAMTAAATRWADDWKARVTAIAAADTVAAARYALEFRDFRAELEQYRIELPSDPEYARRETLIRNAAAGIEYRRAAQAMKEHRPKAAYAGFRAAAGIVADYRDVQERIRTARETATTRVAILPFGNETDVPHLSKDIADAMYAEIPGRLGAPRFQFTRVADRDEVYASMTVKELDALTRESALRIGRGVEADRIVTGRFHGMRASSAFQSFERPIYRRVAEKDSSGKSHDRYVETRFTAVSRERVVTVHCDFDVVDTRTGEVIASRSEPLEAVARVAWTDFRAEGDCGDYCLVPPDEAKADPDRAKGAERAWKECFGGLKLPDMLDHSRKDRRRSAYQSGYRDEFRRSTHDHPVLLGELPGEDDLAYLALAGSWEKVLATLADLDPRD